MRNVFPTIRQDWVFVIPTTMVWLAALGITAWDLFYRQKGVLTLGWINSFGVALMVAGVAIRLLARRALGRHFSYALRTLDRHTLVTHGVYARVRHPAYTGDLLFNFGLPLMFSSVYGSLAMLLLIPCFVYRIRIEEQMLIDRFGDAYREYRRRTQKLIPGVY